MLAVFSIATANADRDEGDNGVTPFTFEVSRIGDTAAAATVDYSVFGSGQNAANVDDFNGNVMPTGRIIFFAGQSSQTLTVNVSGDRLIENDETFAVNLSNPSGDSTIATASANGTIRDDDAPPSTTLSIAATDADRDEGVSGVTPFTFTIVRGGDLSGSTTVDYDVSGIGPQPANVEDFNGNVLPNDQVIFFSGQSSRTITVNVSGDSIVEDDESFVVTLRDPSGSATIENESATGIIRDDDLPPSPSLEIAATNADRQEGDTGFTPFVFTVTRDGNITGATTVDFSVVATGTTAANIDDFNGNVPPSGQVTFFSGQNSQTITVNVTGDYTNEPDETFTVVLSNPSGQATIANGSATGTIRNDDSAEVPTLAIEATNADRIEGGNGATDFTFTVRRDGELTGTASASYTVVGSGSDPTMPADFVGGIYPDGMVTFLSGETTQTIVVSVAGDSLAESDETFTVSLVNPIGNTTIIDATAIGIIRDDDAVDPGDSSVNIIRPNSVTQTHTIPASSFANAIVFQALQDSTISVEPLGFSLSGGVIEILDADRNSIGGQTGDLTTASLNNGQTYAVVFPSQSSQRQYSVGSSSGPSSLTTQANNNLFLPTDSTADGMVTALDALVVINYLNEFGSGTIHGDVTGEYFLDVNGDNTITALDALVVINRLNESGEFSRQDAGGMEPFVTLQSSPATSTASPNRQEKRMTSNDRAWFELFKELEPNQLPVGRSDDSIEGLVQPIIATNPAVNDLAFGNGEIVANDTGGLQQREQLIDLLSSRRERCDESVET